MSFRFRTPIFFLAIAMGIMSCQNNQPDSKNEGDGRLQELDSTKKATSASEYEEFGSKFTTQSLPLALPVNIDETKPQELDKKYLRGILNVDLTPALGSEDVLPAIADHIDGSKYFACGKVKLDTFAGYIVYKQGEDDYYYLFLFNKSGKLTDAMCIAFKEGTSADGTVREAAVNEDGSIELSQYNLIKGKRDREGAERHFYEITNQGKIRDLKSNAQPSHT